MPKKLIQLFLLLGLVVCHSAFAMISMELTRGVSAALPIAITSFNTTGNPSEDVSLIISNDLKNSGRFKVFSGENSAKNINYFKNSGADHLVTGQVVSNGSQYKVSFVLSDLINTNKQGQKILNQSFVVSNKDLRRLAHHISDLIYEQLVGVRGVFSTRLAYVVVQHPTDKTTHYSLEVSDQDGYNPQPLLVSSEPIMSPAWSPDGKQIAYVSFEKRRPSIFIQNVATGTREKITSFPGINGAPAWSPDGKTLALVLSKSGSPNIYLMNLKTKQLRQFTHDWSINTEPAFAPDGKSIIFTSNRSGGPQIYQKNIQTGTLTRITYDGNYNARASFTEDGKHIVLLNQESKLFNIGILDLDNGIFKVLTSSSGTDNESPSVAPNGSMVLYGTFDGSHSILAMAATDGSVQIRLPARNGEVQDPAWSPY